MGQEIMKSKCLCSCLASLSAGKGPGLGGLQRRPCSPQGLPGTACLSPTPPSPCGAPHGRWSRCPRTCAGRPGPQAPCHPPRLPALPGKSAKETEDWEGRPSPSAGAGKPEGRARGGSRRNGEGRGEGAGLAAAVPCPAAGTPASYRRLGTTSAPDRQLGQALGKAAAWGGTLRGSQAPPAPGASLGCAQCYMDQGVEGTQEHQLPPPPARLYPVVR